MKERPSTVIVALSGGIDSSLGAALLKQAGWDVRGLHFLLPTSPSKADEKRRLVRKVADHLGIPCDILDLSGIFTKKVITPFTEAYLKGLTPNPCVLCNEVIKFDGLLDYARKKGVQRMATGHYAIIRKSSKGIFELWRGPDKNKEQSYFLHRLTQTHLSKTLFPLGDLTKREVRDLADQRGLPNAFEPESQEVCFIPGDDYRLFMEKREGKQISHKGDIVDGDGLKVGEHLGTYRYTIGQRHGLGIASPRPYYVTSIRPADNLIVVGRKEDLFSSRVEVDDFRWMDGEPPGRDLNVLAQIRYRHRPAQGRLTVLSPDRVRFEFDEPQSAVTPGQALVCYDGERVLGGGWIRKAE